MASDMLFPVVMKISVTEGGGTRVVMCAIFVLTNDSPKVGVGHSFQDGRSFANYGS